MSELSSSFTDKLFADFQDNSKLRAVENAVTHNGLLKSLETRQSQVENDHVFSIDLTKDKVANQKASGRCWMFAALLGQIRKIKLVLRTSHCDCRPRTWQP